MSKSAFNLEKAQFSDSDQQSPLQINSKFINSYNKQYSLIYQEVNGFLKECKDNILKYISLNQFGVGFNIYNIFTQVSKIQTSMLNGISDVEKQQLDHKKNLKNKYQKQFEDLLQRMGILIHDFLKFQVQFKREYFGLNISKQNQHLPKKNLRIYQSPGLRNLDSQKSVKSSQSLLKKLSTCSRQDEQKKQSELQKKLRQLLKRKLSPQKQNIIKFCDKQSDPEKNILKLEQKIDMMQSEIVLSRTKEEKIIQIFNKRRVQNIQPKGQNLVHCQLIQTDDGNKSKQLIQNNNNKKFSSKQINCQQRNQKLYNNFSKKKIDFQDKNYGLQVDVSICEKINQVSSSSTIEGTVKANSSIKIGSPKGLMSPRGLKSLRDTTSFNFFKSPRNQGVNRKKGNNSPVNFKKKKEAQQQSLHSFSQNSIEEWKLTQNRQWNKSPQHNVKISLNSSQHKQVNNKLNTSINNNINSSINKNHSIFMNKKNNNNQKFVTGDFNLIEQ